MCMDVPRSRLNRSMRNRLMLGVPLCSVSGPTFAWGGKRHEMQARAALRGLPAELRRSVRRLR
jgi:hypothetical protein